MRSAINALTIVAVLVLPNSPAHAGFFFGPESYHECILDRLEGATDDNTATQQVIDCRNEFSPLAPEEKLNPFFFGPKSIKECLETKLATTSSPFAVSQIQEACLTLYPDTGETSLPPQ
jgi:hypothetical protein